MKTTRIGILFSELLRYLTMANRSLQFVGLAMGGKERTEKELVALLDVEGLELVKVWHSKTWQAVVEAKLKKN